MHKSYFILKTRGWASGEPSAINVACSVREGGNGKGPQGTSLVPYFIREGAVENVP
jgi:hypothetical protein